MPPHSSSSSSSTAVFTTVIFFVLLAAVFQIPATECAGKLGVNYGRLGDNLPPPADAVKLLESTVISSVRLFDADPSILTALAGTGISAVVSVANGDIPGLAASAEAARQWVGANVAPYVAASTQIAAIAVGNEVLASRDETLIFSVVPAMENLHAATSALKLDVKISSPHSMAILAHSEPPSAAVFGGGWATDMLTPMLAFLARTGSPFMANPYPFYGFLGNETVDTLAYALFNTTNTTGNSVGRGRLDSNNGLYYSNMFDAQIDALYHAMAAFGYRNITVLAAETGWPSAGDPYEPGVSMINAQTYNRNLITRIQSGIGTPLYPNRPVETYIFGLFNENLKTGPGSEHNYGLFYPNMTPVYDSGVLKNQSNAVSLGKSESSWCIGKSGSDSVQLQQALDYACGQGEADCRAIQENQACYEPNTVAAHAHYAINAFYAKHGRDARYCNFSNLAQLVHQNPSYGACLYL